VGGDGKNAYETGYKKPSEEGRGGGINRSGQGRGRSMVCFSLQRVQKKYDREDSSTGHKKDPKGEQNGTSAYVRRNGEQVRGEETKMTSALFWAE